jgi:2-polyprenyl-3-methyl-5-hydroxy-6-metoxy-1,4-benzoquinol methylase
MDKQTQKELLNIVKRNYEEIAGEFSETRKRFLWPELLKISEEVKSGARVLDVGCGDGRLLRAFKYKDIAYTGIDASEKLIAIAKNKFADAGYKFLAGDILELSQFSEINFDYVFCVAVLQHIPGRDLQIAALRQMKNKIGADGKIILTVWNLWSQKKYRRMIFKFFILKLIKKNKMNFGDILFDGFGGKSQRYYHAFRMGELKKIIKKSGLKYEKIYKDKYNYYAVLRVKVQMK